MVNHVERAYRASPILVELAAKNATTIRYGELATQLGMHHRPIRYVLGVIQNYCLEQNLPPLTILAIGATTGEPGHGFIARDVEDLERGRAEVSAFPWAGLENPFSYAADGTGESDLVDTLVKRPSSAGDVYARVKVRGMAQVIFRKALLQVYASRCALCGLSFDEALEAAHLIPWSEASPQERLDVTNGVLLCATHHKLLDNGWITVGRSGTIHYCDPTGEEYAPYSAGDDAMTRGLHGQPALLPEAISHRPSERALARHHGIHEWGRLD